MAAEANLKTDAELPPVRGLVVRRHLESIGFHKRTEFSHERVRLLRLLVEQIVEFFGVAFEVIDLDHMSPGVFDNFEISGPKSCRATRTSLTSGRCR